MKNPFKKYATISLMFNISLLIIYGYYFHDRSAFSSEGNIAASIEIVNETISETNKPYIEQYLYILRRKPKLQPPISNVIENNEIILNEFKELKDSLLAIDNHISKKEADIIFEKYNNSLFALKNCHDTTLFNIQKEVKFRDKEITAQILNFNQNAIEDPRIYKQNLKGLSSKELKALCFFMENHLVLANTISDNRFSSMVSYRGNFDFNYYYPTVFANPYDNLILGETFEAELTIGSFFDYYTRRKIPLSIYLNNKKIDISMDKYKFELNTNSLGKQNIEAVIHWTHPDTNETGKDTTYFEYTVTP
jgi:hypothetical protein